MSEPQSTIDRVFGAVLQKQTYRNMAYLLLSFPLGIAYFVLLVAGLSAGLLVRSLECMIVHQADYTFWNTLLAGGQLKPDTVPPQSRKYISDKPF